MIGMTLSIISLLRAPSSHKMELQPERGDERKTAVSFTGFYNFLDGNVGLASRGMVIPGVG